MQRRSRKNPLPERPRSSLSHGPRLLQHLLNLFAALLSTLNAKMTAPALTNVSPPLSSTHLPTFPVYPAVFTPSPLRCPASISTTSYPASRQDKTGFRSDDSLHTGTASPCGTIVAEKRKTEPSADSRATRVRRGEYDDGSFGPGDWGWGTDYTTTPVTVEAGSGPATDDGSFEPGDWGWGTDFTTTIITVDATSYDTSTTEYTVYEGVDTTITLAPNIATYTLVPTATHYETSVVVEERTVFETLTSVYTATLKASTITTIAQPPQTVTITEEPDESTSTSTDETTSTSSSSETLPTTPPPWLTLSSATTTTTTTTRRTRTETDEEETAQPTRAVPAQSACLPGDENEKAPGLFDPTEEQRTTLWVMAIYLIGTTIAWNLWGLRALLYGFKSFTVLIHESGHVLGIVLSGQPLYRFTIDPNAGGATHTVPGRLLTPLGLYLGQIFSILFGGVMVFTGFNTWASKYASFGIMALWLPVIALQATLLARLVCAATLGLLVGVWFIEHAVGLRYYILFLGILSSFYILWDTIDDLFHRKQNECCVVMQESNTGVPAMVWFGIWLLLSFLVLVGLILGALAYWRESPHAMYCQAQSFAAT